MLDKFGEILLKNSKKCYRLLGQILTAQRGCCMRGRALRYDSESLCWLQWAWQRFKIIFQPPSEAFSSKREEPSSYGKSRWLFIFNNVMMMKGDFLLKTFSLDDNWNPVSGQIENDVWVGGNLSFVSGGTRENPHPSAPKSNKTLIQVFKDALM